VCESRTHDPSQGCRNQKRQVSLEASGAGARVEVGLTEEHRLSFEQFDPRVPSTPKKDTTEMVDSTLGVVALEPITKEK
jgi:hypothetical protein